MSNIDPEMAGYDGRRRGVGINPKILIAIVVVLFAVFKYYSSGDRNPVTGEVQHVAGLTPDQEVALGLQAVPEMAQQYQGELARGEGADLVQKVGEALVTKSKAGTSPYRFQFHLLRDPETINAFALPGGQVFITVGLLKRLETEGQLAGVLGHEVGHVIDRHGAQHIAKDQLLQGVVQGAVIATTDPNNPNASAAHLAQMIGQMVGLKYGREDELKADRFGITFSAEAGYDPRAMIGVMKILKEAAGGSKQPEFMSTHPDPGNRIEHIEAIIREKYPNGVPKGLIE